MTARQIYGGLAPTFQLPASAGTAGQYIQSTGEGTTVWAAGGGGGGGSGTVTSVGAGPYCVDSGTPTVAPVIGLNIIPLGTVGTNGQVLSATASANELAWIDQTAALSFTLPLFETAGVVSLPIAGVWSVTNNTVQGSSATALEWGPDAAGVTQVKTGANITDSGSATIPNLRVVVAGTYAANDVVGSTNGGVTMTWVTPPTTGGVDSVAAGFGIAVDDTIATAPSVSLLVSGTPAAGNVVQYVAPVAPAVVGTLEWASGVTSIGPGTNTLVAGTPSTPIVNVHVEGAYNAGYVVGSTDAGTTMSWVSQRAAVTSITHGANIVVSTAAPASAAVPAISMPILNDPPTTGQIVGFSGTNTLAWVNNPADGVTSVVEGNGIDVDDAIPTAPVISVAVRPNSFVANNVGTSVNQVDLNVDACPTAGYVLSSSQGGGSGSTAAPTLTWVDPLACLSATAPVTLTAGVIALPIAGNWAAGTNDVVKGSSASALVWGPDSGGTGTVTRVSANNYCAISGVAVTTPTVGLSLSPAGAVGTSGQLLSVSSVTDALAFVNPIITSAEFGLDIDSGVISLYVSGTPANNSVPAYNSTTAGLTWQPPSASGITSIASGAGILISTAAPQSATNPLISVALTVDSFLTRTAGSGFQLDLNAPACPTTGFVLSSTAGGGGSAVAPVLSWIAQPSYRWIVQQTQPVTFRSTTAGDVSTTITMRELYNSGLQMVMVVFEPPFIDFPATTVTGADTYTCSDDVVWAPLPNIAYAVGGSMAGQTISNVQYSGLGAQVNLDGSIVLTQLFADDTLGTKSMSLASFNYVII